MLRISKTAKLAGWNVTGVVETPLALVLAYDVYRHEALTGNVLVCEIGETEINFSVLRYRGPYTYEILVAALQLGIGLSYLDEAVAKDVITEAKRVFGQKIQKNSDVLNTLRTEALQARRRLHHPSAESIANEKIYEVIYAKNCFEEMSFKTRLTVPMVEDLYQPFYAAITEITEQLTQSLKQGNHSTEISHIILAGGCRSVPNIRQLLLKPFPQATIHDRLDPSECAAHGASFYAHLLAVHHFKPPKNALCEFPLRAVSNHFD
ncbi:HSP70-4 [Ramazzottius varieornatus]|uniref:HSP70-4 n=1 Tax=Ramazzottius varieornatus TaxID=947166 RepID=A0A1D1VU35_RAMVA|nr:HSP70-4 [Ramazzottius varieornatus]